MFASNIPPFYLFKTMSKLTKEPKKQTTQNQIKSNNQTTEFD